MLRERFDNAIELGLATEVRVYVDPSRIIERGNRRHDGLDGPRLSRSLLLEFADATRKRLDAVEQLGDGGAWTKRHESCFVESVDRHPVSTADAYGPVGDTAEGAIEDLSFRIDDLSASVEELSSIVEETQATVEDTQSTVEAICDLRSRSAGFANEALEHADTVGRGTRLEAEMSEGTGPLHEKLRRNVSKWRARHLLPTDKPPGPYER